MKPLLRKHIRKLVRIQFHCNLDVLTLRDLYLTRRSFSLSTKGRTFCITLSATTKKAPPVLLNHISAPNVVIASAIVASAAVPGLIPPVRLRVKDANGVVRLQGRSKDELYWDGSIEQVKSVEGLVFSVVQQSFSNYFAFFFFRIFRHQALLRC